MGTGQSIIERNTIRSLDSNENGVGIMWSKKLAQFGALSPNLGEWTEGNHEKPQSVLSVFCIVTQQSLVGGFRRFGTFHSLYLQG